jgi:predicted nuclease of predicted toxin-antitoxin system
MDSILVYECLSPKLASIAQARGLVAKHVARLNLEDMNDWHVAALAAERNYVVVANNRRDILRLYVELEVHIGLIITMPTVPRHEQMRPFALALDVAEHQDSLINLLIEVQADGAVDVRSGRRTDRIRTKRRVCLR